MSHIPSFTDHDRSCLLDALCCVSAADSRISRGEFSLLLNTLKAAGEHGSDHELRTLVEGRCREIHRLGIQKSMEATIAAVRASHNPKDSPVNGTSATVFRLTDCP